MCTQAHSTPTPSLQKRRRPHLGRGLAPSPVTLTLLGHAHFEAFLQPAVLAAVPGHLVDDAILVPVTRIHHVLLDAASEEALGTERKETGYPHPPREQPGCYPQASAMACLRRQEKEGI